jgi:Holliday junction DNA helicase RuvA
MIASLQGALAAKDPEAGQLVVEVGGVGYLVHVSSQTIAALPEVGEPVQLRCHTHVREDALQIFGFLEGLEQKLFELLIAVSGIGPKLALTALSGMPVAELLRAIVGEEHRRLQAIPGIGKKTAERIVLELKDRCAGLARTIPSGPRPSRSESSQSGEVVTALVNLGYKRVQAEKAVVRALEREGVSTADLERLLREALTLIRDA